MVQTRQISARPGGVVVLVGTMKGAFLFRSDARRARWQRGGPYFPGHAVYAMGYDDRAGRRRVWAAPESSHFGAVLRSSDDFGRSWTDPKEGNVRFPEGAGASLARIWQIAPGRASEPDTLYCGVEPAALYISNDGGANWSLVRGLWDHPQRAQWQPGGGGLCLHTVLPDPSRPGRMHIAVSTAGVYRTDDGGATWRPANKGVRAEFLPDKHPEFGQCVHKIARHPSRPDRLFLQNHWGLYRSDDAGESWKDIARGVPSDFGFCMAMHPHDPDTVYIVPLESDAFRCTPEGKLRVYRTTRRRQVLEATHPGPAAEGRAGDGPARRPGHRHVAEGRRVLRHAQRQAVRVGRRRVLLALDRRRAAPDRLREDGHGRGAGQGGPPEGGPEDARTARGLMAVVVSLPSALAPYAGGERRVTLPAAGSTVGQALDELWKIHPALRDRILTEEGHVRRHVNVFVGVDSIRDTGGLGAPVADGAEIAIIPAVSGG